jgi:hypothetical protein
VAAMLVSMLELALTSVMLSVVLLGAAVVRALRR